MSDSHNNRANIKRAIEIINNRNCQLILHCGDLTSSSVLTEFSVFKGRVYCVSGNMDRPGGLNNLSHNIEFMGIKGLIQLGEKKVAFTHYPDMALSLAKNGDYDVVFYGHTHRYDINRDNKIPLINPGEILGRTGKSGFIFYDLHTGEIDKVDL